MPRPKKDPADHHVKLGISFDPEQYKQLIAYCERNDRTASWVIRWAMADWLKVHANDSTLDTFVRERNKDSQGV